MYISSPSAYFSTKLTCRIASGTFLWTAIIFDSTPRYLFGLVTACADVLVSSSYRGPRLREAREGDRLDRSSLSPLKLPLVSLPSLRHLQRPEARQNLLHMHVDTCHRLLPSRTVLPLRCPYRSHPILYLLESEVVWVGGHCVYGH